jgi:hypothetical protein
MRASSTVSLVQVTGSNLTYAYIVLGISLAALAIAYGLRAQVLAASDGTAKMREIAEAIQEGAAAYLARQFRTLSFFVVIVFFLLFALPGDTEIRVGRSIFFLSRRSIFCTRWLPTVCGLQFAQMFALQMQLVTRMRAEGCTDRIPYRWRRWYDNCWSWTYRRITCCDHLPRKRTSCS